MMINILNLFRINSPSVIEFHHQAVHMDILADYFSEHYDMLIKDECVIVHILLEEMLEICPLVIESNILKELIKPLSIVRNVVSTITGDSHCLMFPEKNRSQIFLDLIEEVDAIIDKSGATVVAEIQGKIECNSRLSGMLDLTLSFVNPRLLDDVSFHPCICFKRWEVERVLSFIPSDGQFRLLSYQIGAQHMVALPVYVTPQFTFAEGTGKFNIKVGPKQTMGKNIEEVKITISMPKCVTNVNPTCTFGLPSYYDPVNRIVTWNIGRVMPQKYITMNGTVSLQAGEVPDSNPSMTVEFKISQLAISGLKVNRLDMYGEIYKPFKGIKYITRAGKFQIRS